MKQIFTGLKPTGTLHIGNYFGAILPTIQLFKEHRGYFMVADYHALTSVRDSSALRNAIIENTKDYLAAGLDLSHATLFQQSSVPEHTELAWILNCLVTVPFLMTAHAYKDKVAKGLEANAGLFTYPMLMAADILLYDTELVPVGEDQRQHVEFAREAAAKFNNAFGETFIEPKELIEKNVAIVPGTDGAKMSKSYGNTIPLFAPKDEIASAVMKIVTDSTGERPEHVYAIHSLYRTEAELAPLYESHKGKYKALKEALIEDIEAYVAPMRERRASITDEEVKHILNEGGKRAREAAGMKMAEVRKKVGASF